jgi:hypothetical protein
MKVSMKTKKNKYKKNSFLCFVTQGREQLRKESPKNFIA